MNATRYLPRPWIVFADDWGRHPSSCQHLIRQLLGERDIYWVNTIGTRPPRWDLSTLNRVGNKLGQWFRPKPKPEPQQASASPIVLAPKMWPSFKSAFGRMVNRRLLLRALRPLCDRLPEAPNIITTLPLVADLVGECRANRWIYYCVDDFSVWPGYDGETMAKMERDLVPKMNELVAVSDTLVQHLQQWNRQAKQLTHGVDLGHWQQPAEPLPELKAIGEPLAVFWGVIDRRMDTTFLKALHDKLQTGRIVLIGPQEDPDPELLRLDRVLCLPAMPFQDLPKVAAAASVLIMPYIDAPVTRAMQPLKLKEYLATGKPVVVRKLPATLAWAEGLDLADQPEAFVAAVVERMETGVPAAQQQFRQRLQDESWTAKAALFRTWVEG